MEIFTREVQKLTIVIGEILIGDEIGTKPLEGLKRLTSLNSG